MLTREECAALEVMLERIYQHTAFEYQGHAVEVYQARSRNRLIWEVFIDGQICGSWMSLQDPVYAPLVQLFWRKRIGRLFSHAKTAKIRREFGVRALNKYFPDIDKTFTLWDPVFGSATTLLRQFRKIDGLRLTTPIPEWVAEIQQSRSNAHDSTIN